MQLLLVSILKWLGVQLAQGVMDLSSQLTKDGVKDLPPFHVTETAVTMVRHRRKDAVELAECTTKAVARKKPL